MKRKSLLASLCMIAAAASPCFAMMDFSILSNEADKKLVQQNQEVARLRTENKALWEGLPK